MLVRHPQAQPASLPLLIQAEIVAAAALRVVVHQVAMEALRAEVPQVVVTVDPAEVLAQVTVVPEEALAQVTAVVEETPAVEETQAVEVEAPAHHREAQTLAALQAVHQMVAPVEDLIAAVQVVETDQAQEVDLVDLEAEVEARVLLQHALEDAVDDGTEKIRWLGYLHPFFAIP